MQTQQLEIPRGALRFDAGPVRFEDAAGDNVREHAIELQVRSADAIVNWYWGKIIHDMTGFRIRKDTLPLDWCHDYDEIVGVGTDFKADLKKGLTAKGKLISIRDDDRANEVIQKGKAGVPYECSLDWSGPARIEWVDDGMTVEVNGKKFDGPGYVVREWNCQGVAVCPHGADGSTRTKFTDAAHGDGGISVTLFTQSENPIPMKTQTTAPAAQQQATPVVPAQQQAAPAAAIQQQQAAPVAAAAAVEITTNTDDNAAKFRAELKRFTDKFGAENGTKWFTEGVSYEAALEKHIEAMGQQLTAKEKTIGEQQQKLAAVPRGEEKPASFSTTEPAQTGGGDKKFSNLGDNLSKFAASIKLPKPA